MNKLKTTDNGGMPFELDDLRWLDEGIREGFAGLLSMLGDNYILSGVVISGLGTNNTTWTAGYVVLNGEVLKVEASANPIDTTGQAATTYVELSVSYDADGLDTFENNTQHDTYEIRKATIVTYNAAQVGLTAIAGMPTAKALFDAFILDFSHSFTKRQSFAVGTDSALSSGSAILTLNDYTNGNTFNVDIANYDTAINRFSAPMPNGTWLAIRFTTTGANTSVVLADGVALNNGFDTGGVNYLFKSGEVALFIWVAGKARLVNRTRVYEVWNTVGEAGQPAYGTGWSHCFNDAPLEFSKEGRSLVIRGGASHNTYNATKQLVFTLPAGYRPTRKFYANVIEPLTATTMLLVIFTNGEVWLTNTDLSNAHIGVSLGTMYIPLD